MPKKLKLPTQTLFDAVEASYHNDLLDPDLFMVDKKDIPEAEGVDRILIELINDASVRTLRGLVRAEDAIVRNAPLGNRWSGRKGLVCVLTRNLGLRAWISKHATQVVGQRVIL